MKKMFFASVILVFWTVACGGRPTSPAATSTVLPSPSSTPPPISTSTLPPTETPTLESTPTSTPTEGFGPANFPANVNLLTGLSVANPALLERRPMAIKVENIPRLHARPQAGLSLADIVYEHYTEEGSTRFTAIFYGNDAEKVSPIRSGRLFDIHIVRGYKAIFAFGSATPEVRSRLYGSEFANRLVIYGNDSPLTVYDPNGVNRLEVNTSELSAYATRMGMDNVRQNLDGMFFQLEPPAGGQPAMHIFARYSSAIYNRWDYDLTTGKYLRFSDTANDLTNGQNEKYAQLTDRLTGQPIAFDNLVVLFVTHEYYRKPSPGNTEIIDILLTGSGTAYAFRDGQVYKVRWQRASEAVLSLTYEDGTPFPFKPGMTWFEVVGINSKITQDDQGWRFVHMMP